MKIRCVVIDDEKPARDRIKRLLAADQNFELVGEVADADAAVRLVDEVTPDPCFLDVQMPEGTGFDVLKRVWHVPHVIFVTAFDTYAVSAFAVSSVDYLLKPVGRQRFAQALVRARERVDDVGSARRVLDELDDLRRAIGRDTDEPSARPARVSVRCGSVAAPPSLLLLVLVAREAHVHRRRLTRTHLYIRHVAFIPLAAHLDAVLSETQLQLQPGGVWTAPFLTVHQNDRIGRLHPNGQAAEVGDAPWC